MSTAMHTPHKVSQPSPPQTTDQQKQLRNDRIVAVVVGLIFVGLIALLTWLGVSGVGPDTIEYDYWMMP
jgi:hypothetical protein